ncbi:MAG: hypothetical protein M3Y22_06005 [Pseudomonadota bacterium]|nr:hypothetical protein [Pseudomonadota bacterium]
MSMVFSLLFGVFLRPALVLGPDVEQLMRVEQVFEREDLLDQIAVLPEPGEHRPVGKRV